MKFFKKIDKDVFIVPAFISVVVLIFGIINPTGFGKVIDTAFYWLSVNFGGVYQIGLFFLLIFCLWAGFSKAGNIRLGGKDAKPTMSMGSWIAITFTSGMALGVVFYGVGEGLQNYMSPPGFSGMDAQSAQAAENALRYVFFHWGMHPYAIYCSAGVAFAFIYWNAKRKFSLSSGLYPLLGEKGEQGLPGKIVNWLCLYIMVATLGTNMGLASLQLSSGIQYVFHKEIPETILGPLVIFILAVSGILFACSGIHRAIKYVSTLNMWIFGILVVFAFCFGGTRFIMNNTVTSIGKYLSYFLEEAFYLEPVYQTGFINNWTIYYWAWWLTVAPLTGLFLAKLAKGRTIREFVMVNMFVPVGFIIVWFGTFGSSAIHIQMNGGEIWQAIEEYGFPVALFAYLRELPLSGILFLFGFLAIFLSFTTQSESMTYTMAGMTAADKTEDECGEQKSPAGLKIFWGAAVAVFGYALLLSGGLDQVQRSVVMLGLPVLIILIVNAAGFIKAVRNRAVYDLTFTEKESERDVK